MNARWLRWLESVRVIYIEGLEKVKAEPPKWERYGDINLPEPDWRLWDCVECLDITLSLLVELMSQAKKKKKHGYVEKLQEISGLVDEAISYLDPWSWKPPHKHFRGMTVDSERLRNVLARLREAFEKYSKIFLPTSIEVEAKRIGNWSSSTLLVYRQLRDAVYGLEQFLKQPLQPAVNRFEKAKG